jgi:WD40 repeat protein
MIQTSVAHLYHSALPFTPETPLWNMYRARETSVEARILQGRESEWKPLIRTVLLPNWGSTVRYSHDGRMLAVGGRDFSQLFWSGTGERFAELESSDGRVDFVSFSCDDRVLATASRSTIRLWDVTSGSLTTTIAEDDHAVIWSVDFHPYIGHLLAAGDYSGQVYVWDVRDGSRTELSVAGSTGRLCWVRQGEQRHILVGCEDGRVEMWDVDSLQQVQVFSSSQSLGEIYAVVSSDDGSLVACDAGDGMLIVYNIHTGEVAHSYKHSHEIRSVAFSPTASILAFASDEEVCLWFYTTDRIVIFTGHLSLVNSVVFSPNGRFVASSAYDGTLRLWETDTTNPAPDDIHHSHEIYSVHFSNDGQLIVSASSDKTIKIWDTPTGTLCTTLKGHTSQVWDAIILPDNVHVVSRNDDDILTVWDWQTGKTLLTDTAIVKDHGRFDSLFPYMHAISPLGFISTHIKPNYERTVCCWTIDLSVPGNTRVVLAACGVAKTSVPDSTLRITPRGSTKTSNLALVLECKSGKQFSALWDSPTVLNSSPAQLQFIEELDESPLKHTEQSLTGSELPCRWSDDGAWILDQHDRQILWGPPANRGYRACWHGHCLVIAGYSNRLTLVNFSGVILNNDIKF